jgi:ornithine cyclodeaminase/alanine dehydrogenase-like protein (mu-crystallin family)
MKPRQLLYLSRSAVETINLSMAETIKLIETLSEEKGLGMTELPPKVWIHPKVENSFFSSMPCLFSRLNIAGHKWQSGFPTNGSRGLPFIVGLIVINDMETGFPLAIMDSTWIVAKRTGAASAVGAKYLSRKDSKELAILGCGVQGRSNAEGVINVRPSIKEIKAYDIDQQVLKKYVAEVEERFGVHCVPCKTPKEAVVGADIIVTAGAMRKNSHGTIEESWLKEGIFASPVDYNSYWKEGALKSFDKIYTDDIPTLVHHKNDGFFLNLPEPGGELADVVVGKKPGRENETEKIMFMNIGTGLNDVIVANRIYKIALEKNIGVALDVP